MGLQEAKRARQFKADRQNDMLSASIGAPDHPSWLRAHSSGYAKVKDVYGKGSRRRSNASKRIYEQNQKIQEQTQMLEEQSLQLKQQSQRIAQMEAMMGRVLQHLPPEAQQDLQATHTMPSHIPTQVSSNHVPPQHPHSGELPFILFYLIFFFNF